MFKVFHCPRHDNSYIIARETWGGRAGDDLYFPISDINSGEALVSAVMAYGVWPLFDREGELIEQCTFNTISVEGYNNTIAVAAALGLALSTGSRVVEVLNPDGYTWLTTSLTAERLDSAIRFFSQVCLRDGVQLDNNVLYNRIREELIILIDNPRVERAVAENLEVEEEDYNKHYQGTLIEADKEWVYFERMYSKGHAFIHKLNEDKESISKLITPIKNINFSALKAGIYNSNIVCFSVEKDPNRQWKRGVCKETYKIDSLTFEVLRNVHTHTLKSRELTNKEYWAIGYHSWADIVGMLKLLNSFKENPYYSFNEALEKLKSNERLSCAIDDKFWVLSGITGNNISLFYKNIIFAEITDDTMKVVAPMFYQEALDFLRKQDSKLRIKV